MSSLITERMLNREPFTYGDLAALTLNAADEGRTADKTIQRWRRKGWIEIRGRRGRAPLWHLTKLGIKEAGSE